MGRHPRYKAEARVEAARLYRELGSYTKVAKEMGISRQRAHTLAREGGIPPKKEQR